jgi:hypothetical protein
MPRSHLKNSALISIFLILVSGCTVSRFKNLDEINDSGTFRAEELSVFKAVKTSSLYRCSIDIYKKSYSGLLYIKPVDEGYRVLFITEVGMKIFDFGFGGPGSFIIHYCLNELNRKSVINTLKADLSLMLYPAGADGSFTILKEEDSGKRIIKISDSEGIRYCIPDTEGRISEIVRPGRLKEKVNIKFAGTGNLAPESIAIIHYNIKLRIHLNRIDD